MKPTGIPRPGRQTLSPKSDFLFDFCPVKSPCGTRQAGLCWRGHPAATVPGERKRLSIKFHVNQTLFALVTGYYLLQEMRGENSCWLETGLPK